MNRRNFVKSLLAIGAALSIPSLAMSDTKRRVPAMFWQIRELTYDQAKQYVEMRVHSGNIYDSVAFDDHQIIYVKQAKGAGFELVWNENK